MTREARARRLWAWWDLEALEKALGFWGLGQQALRKGCLLNQPYCDGRELVQPVAHALRFPEDTGAIYKTTELPLPCEVSISTLWLTAQCWGGGVLSLPWSLGARPGMHSVRRKTFLPRRPLRSRLEKRENTGVQENYTSPPSHSSHLEPWISEEGVGCTPKEFCPAFGISVTK